MGGVLEGLLAFGVSLLIAKNVTSDESNYGGGGYDEDEKPARKRGPFPPGRPLRFNSIDDVPDDLKGVYRIERADNSHKYHGLGAGEKGVKDRLGKHAKSGLFDSGAGDRIRVQRAGPDATYDDIRNKERQKIAEHKPTHNKTKGGEGRPPKNL